MSGPTTPPVSATPSSAVRGARRAAIIAIVVSLAVAALLGIIALLSGEFGELQGKVLLTTLTIAAFGTTALCHLAIVTRAVRVVGFVGIGTSIGAGICAFVLIWIDWAADFDTEGWFKALAVLAIIAASLAQTNLLLLLADRPHPLIRVALGVTLVAIAVIAIMVILPILSDGEIPGDHGEGYWRAFGVLAILDALGTIALPILGLVLRRAPSASSGAVRAETAAAAPVDASDRLVLELPATMSAQLDAAATAAGRTRESEALAAIERGLRAPQG